MFRIASYFKAVLIALDQLGNALLGGWPDETFSSRCWRWDVDGKTAWPRKAVDLLFWFDQDHCKESFISERIGRQLPPELRNR